MASDKLQVYDLDDKAVDLLSFDSGASISQVKLNPDRIQHFEEFLDDSPAQPANCRQLGFIAPYFNVDTETVLTRLKHTVIPKDDFFDGGNPDLYSPFWIVTTLIFIVGVTSNTGILSKDQEWSPDFSTVLSAASFLYCLTGLTPLCCYCLFKAASHKVSFVSLLSLYAYSFFLYIPCLLICTYDLFYLRLLVLLISMLWALALVLRNFWGDIRSIESNYKWLIAGVLVGSHCLFAVVSMLYYLG
mmetsp:Transcript_13200/g.24717  ORF Transcript_13200/g.24717 Transcript_13200/m.24717 type:complete len:245 (-) Transcript_13200:3688-4422(-)